MNETTLFMFSVFKAAQDRGEMQAPVEVWATGSNGGIMGAFIGDDGKAEITCRSEQGLQGPIQIFCFAQDGAVSRFMFSGCEMGGQVYERAC